MRRECRDRFPRQRLQRKPLVSDPGMHHDMCVTHVVHVGIVNSQWWWKRSRHSRCMHNPQFYVSDQRPMCSEITSVHTAKNPRRNHYIPFCTVRSCFNITQFTQCTIATNIKYEICLSCKRHVLDFAEMYLSNVIAQRWPITKGKNLRMIWNISANI